MDANVKPTLMDMWEMAESDAEHSEDTASGKKQCDARRILIVDDEVVLQQTMKAILQSELTDHVCETASNGEQAIEMFLAGHPKLVMMDIVMPVLDGEQAFYKIMDICKEKSWQPPYVIFCSGYDPPLGILNVVASDPAHCLIRKPVRDQTLITAVKKRLASL